MDNWEEGLPRKEDTIAAIEYENTRTYEPLLEDDEF
jgi:hypothetical protein